jgi:hypothetical protein
VRIEVNEGRSEGEVICSVRFWVEQETDGLRGEGLDTIWVWIRVCVPVISGGVFHQLRRMDECLEAAFGP